MRFSVFLYIRLTASCLQKRNGADDTGNTRQFFRSQGLTEHQYARRRARPDSGAGAFHKTLFSDYAL